MRAAMSEAGLMRTTSTRPTVPSTANTGQAGAVAGTARALVATCVLTVCAGMLRQHYSKDVSERSNLELGNHGLIEARRRNLAERNRQR
jgi:hypothetical protein